MRLIKALAIFHKQKFEFSESNLSRLAQGEESTVSSDVSDVTVPDYYLIITFRNQVLK